jgi:hypothetical protein
VISHDPKITLAAASTANILLSILVEDGKNADAQTAVPCTVNCFNGCIKSIFNRKVHKETAGNAKWQL